MALSSLVGDLIGMVERGRFLDSLARFYAGDAEVRENEQAARIGIDALIANEKVVLAACKSVTGKALTSFTSGDQAVIHWLFEFTAHTGAVTRLDELALQTWRGGEIVREKFYYDPAQLRAAAA